MRLERQSFQLMITAKSIALVSTFDCWLGFQKLIRLHQQDSIVVSNRMSRLRKNASDHSLCCDWIFKGRILNNSFLNLIEKERRQNVEENSSTINHSCHSTSASSFFPWSREILFSSSRWIYRRSCLDVESIEAETQSLFVTQTDDNNECRFSVPRGNSVQWCCVEVISNQTNRKRFSLGSGVIKMKRMSSHTSLFVSL